MVDTQIVVSSSTSSKTLTVSRAVNIVMLFSVASALILYPSEAVRAEPASLVLIT